MPWVRRIHRHPILIAGAGRFEAKIPPRLQLMAFLAQTLPIIWRISATIYQSDDMIQLNRRLDDTALLARFAQRIPGKENTPSTLQPSTTQPIGGVYFSHGY